MAKLMDQGPVLVLTFQAQQLTVRRSGREEEPDDVSTCFLLIHTYSLPLAGIYLLLAYTYCPLLP